MRITQLNHTAFHVADVPKSVTFYREVLGLEPMDRPAFNFPGAWFRVGVDQELHLIAKPAGMAPPPREGHCAFMVDDIHAFAGRLRAAGLTFTGPKPRPDGALQVFLNDPDGHVLELCTAPADG